MFPKMTAQLTLSSVHGDGIALISQVRTAEDRISLLVLSSQPICSALIFKSLNNASAVKNQFFFAIVIHCIRQLGCLTIHHVRLIRLSLAQLKRDSQYFSMVYLAGKGEDG